MSKPSKTKIAGVSAIAALALAGAGIANASNNQSTPAAGGSGSGSAAAGGHQSGSTERETIHAPDSSGSRLDDGADLLPQAKITEQQAIAAARTAASGPLNEIDLEDYQGTLVFNVDVGSHDVKVDASNGDVLAAPVDE